MQALRRMALCLVAAAAVGAIAAGSASAALPEFSPPFPNPLHSTSKATILESIAKVKVKCIADTNEGEVTGPVTGTIKFRFTGCESKTIPCKSPNAPNPGEIDTPVLSLSLGYITHTPTLTEVGIDISSPTGAPVMEFFCGAALRGVVDGSVIGKITPINKLVSPSGHFVLKFAQKAGHQAIQHFEAGPIDILEASFGGPFEPAGLASTDLVRFALPMKVNA